MASFSLHPVISAEALASSLAGLMGVPQSQVGTLEDGDEAAAVLIEAYPMGDGFRTNVTLHIDPAQAPTSSVHWALQLARHLGVEALVEPSEVVPASNALTWLLIKPAGDAYLATEVPSGDEDAVDIDRSKLIPVSLSVG
jgi:hypothetical protein